MSKIILTDIDNSVLDFSSTIEEWLRNRDFDVQAGDLNKVYNISSLVGSVRLANDLLSEFFHDPIFGTLQALDNTVEPVRELYKNGWTFVCISACEDNPLIKERRIQNLENVFEIPFEVHLVGAGGDKTEILSQFDSTYWVEDHIENAKAGHALGHKTFLISQPYNKSYDEDELHVVSDWIEIAKHII